MAPLFWWLIFGVVYPTFATVTAVFLWHFEIKNWPQKRYGELSPAAIWAMVAAATFPLFTLLGFAVHRVMKSTAVKRNINYLVEKELQKRIKNYEERLGIKDDD
jgi:hypothetical protein